MTERILSLEIPEKQQHKNIHKIVFVSWGEGACLALVDHPSSDGVTIKYLMG